MPPEYDVAKDMLDRADRCRRLRDSGVRRVSAAAHCRAGRRFITEAHVRPGLSAYAISRHPVPPRRPFRRSRGLARYEGVTKPAGLLPATVPPKPHRPLINRHVPGEWEPG